MSGKHCASLNIHMGLIEFYPPSQKTMDVSPWMNAQGEPFEALRAKEGASADYAEEMKDTTGVSPWRLHSYPIENAGFRYPKIDYKVTPPLAAGT